MPDIKELTRLALAGDLNALQEMRERGVLKTSQPELKKAATYPLSHAQRRLWILNQMGGSAAYNLPGCLLLEGKLDRDACDKTFAELIRRHESLRTVFVSENGEPRQKIGDARNFRVCFQDLAQEPDPDARAGEIADADVIRPFDLENGPLIRVMLLKTAQDRHFMIFNMHHIISDGWSLGILARDFCRIYQAIVNGQDHPLPRLPIQYKDYAAWQNRLLADEDKIGPHQTYWLEKLSGDIPALNLPADFPRPPVTSFKGDMVSIDFSQEQTQEIHAYARKNDVSLFMLLSAAVKVLLYRYTEQEDILIGFPIAGRNHADTEDQIGFYVNSLVLRDQISGDMRFQEFLKQVRASTTEAYSHQVYPFDKLVEDLNLRRDLSRSPLFDVMVILQDAASLNFSLDHLTVRTFNRKYPVSKFDLTFEFGEWEPSRLRLNIEYCTDLFREDRIQRMASHFQTLMDSILTDSDQPVSRLNILTDEERNQILFKFNDTETNYPHDKTIVDLFEAQVEKTPDNTAVMFRDTRLTYRELNEHANRVAHFLRDECHVRPDDRIGILVDRSQWLVIGLLGIMKAGGAYVPIDPAYPLERIRYMLQDSHSKAILTEKQHRHQVSDMEACFEIADIRHSETANCSRAVRSDHLAYLIYTSGSTGQPKGVMIEHRSVVNTLWWRRHFYAFGEKDRVLQIPSYSFDSSVEDIFTSLISGSGLVMIPQDKRQDITYLESIIPRFGVTHFLITPGFYKILLTEIRDALKSLRFVTVAGENMGKDLVSLHFRHLKEVRLYNEYGPTENSVCSTVYEFDPTAPQVLIGSPIDNNQIYIIDKTKNLCPMGVPGEICLSGPGLARGYLNREDLTTDKFIENPFSAGKQIYLTGDIGRWTPDGSIEFLGRADEQVKIRGFRIELGEIENLLEGHPKVRSSVVVVGEDHSKDKCLIAYLVPASTDDTSLTTELRDFLRKKLPDHMVPSAFVTLAEMPLTPNGKVDRKALPAPDHTGSESEATYVAPRNGTEQAIAEIWQDLLNLGKVGVNDKFFDIGGHSLLVIQMQRKLRKQFDREISVPDLFTHTTVAALSEHFTRTPAPAKPDTGVIRERSEKRRHSMRQRQKRKQRR